MYHGVPLWRVTGIGLLGFVILLTAFVVLTRHSGVRWSDGSTLEDKVDVEYFRRHGPAINWKALQEVVNVQKFQTRAALFSEASHGLLKDRLATAHGHGLCKKSTHVRAAKEMGFNLEVWSGFAYYLHLYGCLNSTASFEGTHPFWFFSPHHSYVKKSDLKPREIWTFDDMPRNHPFSVVSRNVEAQYKSWNCTAYKRRFDSLMIVRQDRFPSYGLIWPPFHAFYKTAAFDSIGRRIAVVGGKHTIEWNHAPVNSFANPSSLRPIIDALLENDYFVIYNRPSIVFPGDVDSQKVVHAEDYTFLRATYSWSDVILFQDIRKRVLDAARIPYSVEVNNLLLLSIYASASIFVVTQGGNAVVASLFPGEIFVLHHEGSEMMRPHPLPDGNDFVYPRWSQHGGARFHVSENEEDLSSNLRSHLRAQKLAEELSPNSQTSASNIIFT